MRFFKLPVIIALMTVIMCSCTGIKVKRNPSACDTGIRYYRPKPYLLLSPVSEGQHSGQAVSISLEYLPDFSEEYSIHLKTGLNGSVSADITLDQGWNLTGLDVAADPQTDDLIDSVANAIPKLTAGGGGEESRFVIQASNVPLGYYEAVTGHSQCGKKLFGWRYVGFMPFIPCPAEGYGEVQPVGCHPDEVYGLVWEGGTLTFKPVNQIGGPQGSIQSRTGVQSVPVDN